jgi:hypothetical protein
VLPMIMLTIGFISYSILLFSPFYLLIKYNAQHGTHKADAKACHNL